MERTMSEPNLPNIHPGEILSEEFLKPLNITPYRLSKEIGVPQTRISAVLAGKRAITADTALRLARFFGSSPEFWMNLQTRYDLRLARRSDTDARVPLATGS
jgi:addiction module HigA family antidote